MRGGRRGSRSTSFSIQLPPAATSRMHSARFTRDAVLRMTPATPACSRRSASGSLMITPQTITAVGLSAALNRRTQSAKAGRPKPLSTISTEGCRSRTAGTASSTLVSATTTRGPSIASMRLRKPSMATGSGSQTARVVSTAHTKHRQDCLNSLVAETGIRLRYLGRGR